jgi:hypothetical protein
MKFKLVTLIIIILIAYILACTLAYANDQDIVGIGGSLKILNGENPSIQMVSEIVTMDIYPTYYDVKASFIFLNHSNSITVKMGFPETGHGGINLDAIKTTPGFINFSTYVDGTLTPAKRMMVSVNDGYGQYKAYWVKEVPFKAKQQRKVDVVYRSKVGDIALPGLFAEYNFTGGNWYGKVKESRFIATLHLPVTYEVHFDGEYNASFYGSNDTRINLKPEGNRLYFSQKNWEAEGYIRILLKKPTNWDLANPIALNQNSVRLLDRIKGSWVNEDYINRLKTTKSPIKAMKELNGRSDYQILIVNGKYAWNSENNQCINSPFGEYIRDIISLPDNNYQLLSDRGNDPEKLSFNINFNNPEITEITSQTDGTNFFLNKSRDLEGVANEIVLAGKYQDDRGQIYLFGTDEVARWPQQSFKYKLNVGPFYDLDWFVNNDDNEKRPDYYAFEFKDGLLYLYKAKNIGAQRELKLKREDQPLLILKPVKNILPSVPQNLLSPEYAKYFNKYPGGKDLSQIEQIIEISKANSLSEEGFAFYKAKNDPSAIKKYEEALKYYASPETYYRYGNSLSNIARLDDAIKAYQIAIDLKYDKLYLVYYNIACIYSRVNNSKQAFSYLELATNNGYRNLDHIQKDADLTWLRLQPEWKDWWEKHKP